MTYDRFTRCALQALHRARDHLDRAILDLKSTEHPIGLEWALTLMDAHRLTTEIASEIEDGEEDDDG